MRTLLQLACIGLYLSLFCAIEANAQAPAMDPAKKQLRALRIEQPIELDGLLDDPAWQQAETGQNFILNQPRPGEKPTQTTEVKVLYDDSGIYIGATLYDAQPDSVMQELSQRDNLGNTDWFGVFIDAFRDGINGFGFITTPAEVQFDAKYSTFGEDENWDAVWENKARRTPQGWSVELKIPYAALRFPDAAQQVWHIHFARFVARNQEKSFWTELNPQINGLFNQSGYLTGIENIKPPLRIQATPYLAVYGLHHHDSKASPVNSVGHSINGGMDVKVGLSDAFTLDMTLIPDFGEAQSDNQVLNLSPFEVRFDENRAFFTEGTELFNKGGLFYSRRIGGQPFYAGEVSDQVAEGETLVNMPRTAQLYNATKISGRTPKGTGLGFFNATSGRSYATISNPESGDRRVLADPFTNYNVLVVDQNLPNNSYATFINTTVLREGDAYDANVTGADFNLRNKDNSYAIQGFTAVSQQYHPGQTDLGHTATLGLRKTSGKLQAGLTYAEESHTYDPNDLGFLYNNNSRVLDGFLEYNRFEPFGAFNSGGIGLYSQYARVYSPSRYANWGINVWGWLQTKKFWNFNAWTYIEPSATYDYFEPRTPGRFWRNPGGGNVGFSINTDRRKRLQLSVETSHYRAAEPNRYNLYAWLSPRLRVSDRFNISLTLERNFGRNNTGFVANAETPVVDPNTGETTLRNDIILGRRNLTTVEAGLRANYTFHANMILSLRLRHYWSKVEYQNFYLLQQDGRLGGTAYADNHDGDFDAFNIDLIYRWRFAPGSDLIIVWKNSILSYTELVSPSYVKNFDRLLQEPQDNNLSVKAIYFLDYASLVRKR